MAQLTLLRLPLLILALVVIFVAERYFASYDFYLGVVAGGVAIFLLPLLSGFMKFRAAKQANQEAEAQSWCLVLAWQSTLAAGIALYYLAKLLPKTPADSPLIRVSMGLWISVVTLAALGGIGIELAHRVNGEGQAAEPKRLRFSGMSWLSIGFLLIGLFSLNYGFNKKDKVFDVSYFKTTKPGESTTKLVQSLKTPIRIGVFFSKESEVLPFAKEYVQALAKINSNVQVEVYDKDFHPVQAEEFRVSRNGQIVLVGQDAKRQRIDLGEKLESARKKLRTLDSLFQKELLQLTKEPVNVYFMTNHGEMGWEIDKFPPPRSLKNFETILRSQNMNPRKLPTAFAGFPEDAHVVAIMAPTTSLIREEVAALKEFLGKGGKVLIALDIESAGDASDKLQAGDQSELLGLLKELGVTYEQDPLANDREFVRNTRQASDYYFLYTNIFGTHESVTTLTRNDERLNVLFFQAGSWTLNEAKDGWKTTATIQTKSNSYQDKNRNFVFDEASEKRSTFPVAFAAEKDLGESKKARVLAFSDGTLFSDPLLQFPGNQWASLDGLRWLVDRAETAGTVETEEDVMIQHAKARELFVFHGSIFLVPLLVLGCGFFMNRRKRG